MIVKKSLIKLKDGLVKTIGYFERLLSSELNSK